MGNICEALCLRANRHTKLSCILLLDNKIVIYDFNSVQVQQLTHTYYKISVIFNEKLKFATCKASLR